MSKAKSTRKDRTSVPARSANLRPYGSGASAPPTVSAKWLLSAIAMALAGALFCAWGTLCLLFWQGNWQLLYHPTSAVTRTPASVNLAFDSVEFATNTAGEPQLRGWWIPASSHAHYTAIYLHGADGNLGDAVDALARLHASGLNIFAFDYRGYGQSRFVHPSEARWREDADSAIGYLTGTRHIPVNAIILVGKDLGANLAVETAATHPDLAGVVLEQPLASPTLVIFSDARAHLVPAHWLVSDRWQTSAAAGNILIPSLWFYWTAERSEELEQDKPEVYEKVPARKMLVWLTNAPDEQEQFRSALSSWLDQLPAVAR
ncbi:MAG TPA: alpha/beta fold hydrolase [Terracidiphilus sp.]|nr:alpha/beta fold hydrolase [Terracidiphilus sp.]